MSLVDPASFTDGDILCQTCENIAFLFATKQRRKSTDGCFFDMETHEKFLEGGGSRISKWKPSGDIYKDMNVSKALSILSLRERDYRDGDVKVLQNAFAKKLSIGDSSQQQANPGRKPSYNFQSKDGQNNPMIVHEAYQFLLRRKGYKSMLTPDEDKRPARSGASEVTKSSKLRDSKGRNKKAIDDDHVAGNVKSMPSKASKTKAMKKRSSSPPATTYQSKMSLTITIPRVVVEPGTPIRCRSPNENVTF